MDPRFDPDLINLRGAIFDTLPHLALRPEVPRLELHEPNDAAVEAGATVPRPEAAPDPGDSLRPTHGSDPGEEALPTGSRPSPWAVGLAIAAGATALVAASIRPVGPVPAAPAVAEASAVIAPVPEQPAPPPAITRPAPRPAVTRAMELPGPVPPRRMAIPARTLAVAPTAAPPPTAARPTAAPPPSLPPTEPAVELDRGAAARSIAAIGRRSGCHDEEGTVTAALSVTFAPSGRVLSARVTGGQLVGTPAGGCLAAALRGARVPAFSGDPVTVNTTLQLP